MTVRYSIFGKYLMELEDLRSVIPTLLWFATARPLSCRERRTVMDRRKGQERGGVRRREGQGKGREEGVVVVLLGRIVAERLRDAPSRWRFC